jgi:hypothetical protein
MDLVPPSGKVETLGLAAPHLAYILAVNQHVIGPE